MSIRLARPIDIQSRAREARLVVLGVIPLMLAGALLAAAGVRAGFDPSSHSQATPAPTAGILAQCLVAAGAMLAPIALFKRRRMGGDPLLYPSALLLWTVGYWCWISLGVGRHGQSLQSHPITGLCLGVVAYTLLALTPADRSRSTTRITRFDLPRYAYLFGVLAVALILTLAVATTVRHRVVLSLGGLQIGEVARALLVLFAAGVAAERTFRARGTGLPSVLKGLWHASGPVVIVWGSALLLAAAGKDYGPAAVMLVTLAALLSVLHRRWWVVAGVIVVVCAAVAGASALRLGVIPLRVAMWQDPWTNGLARGNQVAEAHWALATGGLSGSGLGLGQPGRVAQAADDMVLATVGEQLGFIGVLGVLVALALLSTRSILAGVRALEPFDRCLALAVGLFLAVQALVISGGVSGAIPLTGIALPLVAHGNTGIVCWMALLGLVRGISASPAQGAGVPDPLRSGAAIAAVGVWVGLVGIVGVGFFGRVELLNATRLATRQIMTRHRDKLTHPDSNPRLAAIARSVRRGRILDCRGQVLASGPVAKRRNPYGDATVHLVGMASELFGLSGLERECDTALRGYRDDQLLAAYRNKDLPWKMGQGLPRAGTDVTATISAEWQKEAQRLLRYGAAGTRRPKDARGAVVVMDIDTGAVVVSASEPAFDPEGMDRGRWDALASPKGAGRRSPFLDRARQGYYAPGSTLKVAVAAIGLEAGLDPTFRCNHATSLAWRYGNESFSRARLADMETSRPHGRIGMAAALPASCNVYFAQLGLAIGADRLHDGLERFGFARLPSVADVGRSLPDTAFGQGRMLVTPTEMALVAASVAKGGVRPELRYWRVPAGATARAAGGNRVMDTATAAKVGAMMTTAVTSGTAVGIFSRLGIGVAGKTGSAETGTRTPPHSWFMGYAPVTRPRFAFACIVENGGHGRSAAAPICRDLLERILAGP